MHQDTFLSQIAEAVDLRREEITRIKRVVGEVANTTLESTAAIMALPMLYAHWEGFVKESVEMYIEYIDKQALAPSEAHPVMFSFSIKKKIRALLVSGSVERIAEFADWMISNVTRPLFFEEKSVETGSNLSYENLCSLCETLRIDVALLEGERKKINKLVHRRNNIAHTGRPLKVNEGTVDEDAKLALRLIETFESILRECVAKQRFMSLHNAIEPTSTNGVAQSPPAVTSTEGA